MYIYIYIYMMIIFESISTGLIISLINTYTINTTIIDQCMQNQDKEATYDSEVSSVVAGVSDSSCVHHAHV